MLNRPSDRATKAEEAVKAEVPIGGKTQVETVPCDLQDFASVRAAATTIKSKYRKIDVLCNNAGVMALNDYATKDGYDVQVQTNVLSHFLLTKELFPLLSAAPSGRVVHHSSIARHGGPLKAEYFGKNGGNLGGDSNWWIFGQPAKWERYHQTKLANAVITLDLASRFSAKDECNVIAACAAPGFAATNLQDTTQANGGGMGVLGMITLGFRQSAEDGTMPLLAACFSPETNNGDFWEPPGMGVAGEAVKKELKTDLKNAEQQKMLWDNCEEACGEFML